jgi:hypothetical protein
LTVQSENKAGSISGLKSCWNGGVRTRIRCKSGVACKHRLKYRSEMIGYFESAQVASDASTWHRLC